MKEGFWNGEKKKGLENVEKMDGGCGCVNFLDNDTYLNGAKW